MTQNLDFLSDHEVRQITALVDTLDRSNFDYLQVDVGAVKVTIGKGALPAPSGSLAGSVPAYMPAVSGSAASAPAPAPAPASGPAPVSTVAAPVPPVAVAAVPTTWQPITATTMGRYYSRPDPNSPPFVQVGGRIGAEDTVCLIEVMKLFNAITAGVEGTVMRVCVEDAAVVEFGQVLFYVQP